VFDAAGRELPFNYRNAGDQMVTNHAPRRVDVVPGGASYVTTNKYRCDLGDQALGQTVELRCQMTRRLSVSRRSLF